ncbi:MAG: Ig-like domain-containing protein, partial [Actinomycetota bacterium]|nr:Ig-like domain-containing protein [Actinomycetota bacterium]
YISAAFTTSAAGTYRWIAAYGGDANNSAVTTACGDANESVVVSKAAPTIVTTASAPVAVGGTISDSAVLSGGVSPTGTITFNVYGPSDATCSSAPVFTSTVAVNSGNGTYGSGNFTPTSPGTYRFVASYSGDTNNAAVSGTCGAAGESVVVGKAAPTIVTTASAPVTVGGTMSDSAVLAGGVAPTSTITFNAYGPNDATCSNTPAFTSTATVSGNGTYSSATFTTSLAGTYRFIASYSGDANNGAVAGSCGAANESVVVAKASPTIATTASGPASVGGTMSDSGVLAGGVSPTGTITFNVYGPNDATCSNTPAFTSTATVSGNGTYGSGNFTPAAPGTYRFVASYGGDANNAAVAGTCGAANESVAVSKASPAISTTASAGIPLGGTISDSAVLSGGVGATGTITFNVYGPNDATCANAVAFTGTATVSGNGTYGSGNFTPTAPGTYRFTVSYGGDANNSAVASSCNASGESVVVTKASPALATKASDGVALGGQVTDTATISGGVAPSGTVVFRLYGPGDSSCSNAPAFTSSAVTVSGNGAYTSPGFAPTAVGTYTWVASYSGDANNNGVPFACGAPNESVVVGQVATTTTLVSSPNPSALGQAITFTATVTGTSPTGTVTFKDGSTSIGTGTLSPTGTATLTTSTLTAGTHSITAVYGGDASNAGSTSAAVQQVVNNLVGPPTITITSPTNGASYKYGKIVHASYSCSDPQGPGIALCTGPVANGSPINTRKAGKHTFTVVAASKDGKTATQTVTYTVKRPDNDFTVSHIKISPDGTVSFDLKLPGPGIVDVLETAWKGNIVAGAASLLQPSPGRFVFARKHIDVSGAGTVHVVVKPGHRGRVLIAHPRFPIVIRLWVSYTPTGGFKRSKGSFGLHVPRAVAG